MAKKGKGARTSTSRGGRKTRASGGARKSPAKRARATTTSKKTGLESSKTVNLTPLKTQIRANIARLERAKYPTAQVQDALETLKLLHQRLGSICGDTMVIPT